MIKKYFEVNVSTKIKEIGDYPQGGQMKLPYDYDATDSIEAVERLKGKYVPFVPNMGEIILCKIAKFTDVLSLGPLKGSGLWCSERLKELLSTFKLPSHQFFQGKVSLKSEVRDYHWLHLHGGLMEHVDFSRSLFHQGFSTNYQAGDPYGYRFENYEKYMEFANDPHYKMNGWPRAKMIYFDETVYSPSTDVFYIGGADKSVYVSRRLKKALKDAGITGIEIKDGILQL